MALSSVLKKRSARAGDASRSGWSAGPWSTSTPATQKPTAAIPASGASRSSQRARLMGRSWHRIGTFAWDFPRLNEVVLSERTAAEFIDQLDLDRLGAGPLDRK